MPVLVPYAVAEFYPKHLAIKTNQNNVDDIKII